MTNPGPAAVKVEQCDREAAHRLMIKHCGDDWKGLLRGEEDQHAFIQILAAHRLAERERCARVAEQYPSRLDDLGAAEAARGIAIAIFERTNMTSEELKADEALALEMREYARTNLLDRSIGYALMQRAADALIDRSTPSPSEQPAIPAEMVPWSGGDSAPTDWDGGKVLLRSGDYRRYPDEWRHGNTIEGRHWDIIAYTPRATEQPAIVEGEREAIARAAEWLRACSTWLLSNDLDMQMPGGVLDTDPLDLAEALEAQNRPPSPQAGLIEALRTAERYILHVGANQTEAGLPHPQQQLLDQIRTALLATTSPDQGEDLLTWAVDRWRSEVANRPLHNVHRRSLDDAWRQVVRKLGGDDVELLGPRHDDLLASPDQGEESGEKADA